jgi:eukaryotic-like serine/threonine-protein kinase
MSTCAACGTISTAGAVFCGGCGAALGKQGTVPGAPPNASMDFGKAATSITAGTATSPAAPGPRAVVASTAALDAQPTPGSQASASASHPAAPPAGAPRGPLAEGTLIDGKYAVTRVLGQGGMGVVYLARDIHTGLDVVVKAMRRELAHRPDVRQRTLAEGRALARIDHPNVVHLKAVVVEGPSMWLVMQYIDGESLDATIARYEERGERMPFAEALGIFQQIVAGIGAAHQEGVIHRDLKPANVLLRRKDHVAKVTDFGIAKLPDEADRQQTRGIIGSLWYMSPEQVTGRRDLDQRVDIYALGILLYQMLTGRVPFDAESDYDIMRMHAEAPMPRVAALRADVPAGVDDLIQKACTKDRALRFQSCEALGAAVARLLSGPPRATLPDPAPGQTMPASRPPIAVAQQGAAPRHAAAQGRAKWPLALGGIAVTLSAVGAVGVLLRGKETGTPSQRERIPPAPTVRAADAAAPHKSPLEALVGAWIANGKELDAILVGGVLEFRVRAPAQFEPQNYEAGEARFELAAEPALGADVFAVEDRIRPLPPHGTTYDPRSRNTCQEAWSSVNNEPLRARFDGERLTVDLAKIEPTTDNFSLEGGKRVVGCRGLAELKASRVVNTLTRP